MNGFDSRLVPFPMCCLPRLTTHGPCVVRRSRTESACHDARGRLWWSDHTEGHPGTREEGDMRIHHRHWTGGVLLLVALLGQAMSGWAGFNEGLAAYKQGDYATALREWRPLAAQGAASAQYNLALLYTNGEGVLQDDAQAVHWYRKAADQGHAGAQNNLGVRYFLGKGVLQDFGQAAHWSRKAADQGLVRAQYLLGTLYAWGAGVPLDSGQAYFWFNVAAARMPSGVQREDTVKARDALVARLTPAQLTEAQARARTWQPTVATPETPSPIPPPGAALPQTSTPSLLG